MRRLSQRDLSFLERRQGDIQHGSLLADFVSWLLLFAGPFFLGQNSLYPLQNNWILDLVFGHPPSDPFLCWQLRPLRSAQAAMVGIMDGVFSQLYQLPLWIPRSTALEIAEQGMTHLTSYVRIAKRAFDLKLPLFPITSKLHAMDHIFRRLRWEADISANCLNPLAWGVQMDEDVIGRACKLSRRCSPRETVLRTLQRYLEAAHLAWEGEGWRCRV